MKLNNKGLSLIEVMIALVILLLVMLALMQTALVSIDSNMVNVLRDEAVGIAEQRMNEARNMPFDDLAAGPTDVSPLPRSLRNISDFQYTATRWAPPLGTDARQIRIRVTWEWKENPYTHIISTIVRRQ